LRRRYPKCPQAREKIPWRALYLIAASRFANNVAKRVGRSSGWSVNLARRYNELGAAGVGDQRGEVACGAKPTLTAKQAPVGERSVATVAPDYEWLWMNAAAYPSTDASFWLALPRLDGEMAQLLLAEFAMQQAAGKQIIQCWDAAPAHRAQRLRVPGRITLLPLPPYTPELNPAANLWLALKEGVANRSFKDLKGLEKTVCQRSRKIAQDTDSISERLSYHWRPNA
jgi:hypothetical protein